MPAGGPKVVYEYANHLTRRGHRVTLVHPALNPAGVTPLQAARGAVAFIARSVTQSFRPTTWFPIEPSVRLRWVPSLSHLFIPDGDAVVATAWSTAERITKYPASKGRQFYLIQSWETWHGPNNRVIATWKAPLTRIVIASWLLSVAKKLGVEAAYIPNAIDHNRFGVDTRIEDRDPNHVMMLLHPHPVKGSADGLEALSIVKERLPELRLTLFGTSAPNASIPSWAEYRRLPNQQELRECYNRAALFVAPGHLEGWPLPPAEAMLCGAALVATNIPGHREYAIHGNTALLSPAKDTRQLANNIVRLISDRDLRLRIARAGHEYIKKFRWEESVDSFEAVLIRPDAATEQARSPRVMARQVQDLTW
jgi:glycosyltransferase involved in cell wall biosynthesis